MREGIQTALRIFKSAASEVPAYRDFLKKHKINAKNITADNFSVLPLTDKKGYVNGRNIEDLVAKGQVPAMVYASSGSSGQPTFWFRNDLQEKVGAEQHKYVLEQVFGLKKNDQVLIIVCFSMGVWVAGNYTMEVFRELRRQGYNITVATPGVEKEDIYNILKKVAPLFKNIIIAGYPPFLMDVAVEANKRKIMPKGKIFGLTAGDKFSEQWRDEFLKQIGSKDSSAVCSIYGCADAGVLGMETKLSILLRKAISKNKQFYAEFFGNEQTEPAVVQYDPKYIYFENVGEEIVFTTNTAAPLIRYNIHDIGRVYSPQEVKDIIRTLGLGKEVKKRGVNNNLPLIIKKGRTDVAVTFYALNIYPEHIKMCLDGLAKYVSGNYLVYNKNVNKQKIQQLHFVLELNHYQKPNKKLEKTIQELLINKLSQVNIEYRKLLNSVGQRAYPVIHLVPANSELLVSSEPKALLQIKGKKPRVVLQTI